MTVREKRKKFKLPRIEIKVGILDEEAEDGDQTVLSIAAAHEFGLGVPVRSWLRGWVDARGAEVQAMIAADLKAGVDIEQTANLAAFKAAQDCASRVKNDEAGLLPITNPKTIASKLRRGYNPPYTPLVESGTFTSSIAGEAEIK